MISIITLIVEIMVSGLCKQSDGTMPPFLAMVWIAIITMTFLADISLNKKLAYYSTPLIMGYFWRLFLVFFDLYGKGIYNLPNSGYDSEMFYSTAVSFVITGNPGRGEMFSTVMGTIFSYSGTSRLFGQYIVMLFSIVSICSLVYMLEELQIDQEISYRVVGLVAFLPNFAILSSIYLRESIITMFLSISILCFVYWLKRKKEIWFLFAFGFSFIAALFHSGSAAAAIGYIAVRLIYDKRSMKIKVSIRNIFPAVIFVSVLSYIYINYADVVFSKMSTVSSIADVAATSSEGGSSYAAYVGNSNSLASMAVYTIPRIIYFLFSPFPWQWRNLSDIIAFVFSSLFYIASIKVALGSIKRAPDTELRTYTVVLLIVAICTVFVFAWGVSNTGTATRHRDKMIILFAIIYALGRDISSRVQGYL